MEEQQKLPSELEEQIQSLAGDIYIQIEDKISSLLSAYPSKAELTPELVEQHEHYQALKSSQQALAAELEKSSQESTKQSENSLQELKKIKAQLDSREEELKNNAELNNAKLTDTEQVLKNKLEELSVASEQLKNLKESEHKNNAELEDYKKQISELTSNLSQLKDKEESLTKNDKAKAATLEVQNHKISELTNQLNNVSAELEVLKSDQSQSIEEKSESLLAAKNQINDLTEQLANAQQQVTKAIEKQEQLNVQIETLQTQQKDGVTAHGAREHELVNEIEKLKASLNQSKSDSTERASQLSDELSKVKESLKQSEEKNQEQIAAQNVTIQQLKVKEVKLLDDIKTLEEGKVNDEQIERELAGELVDTKQALDARDIELAEARGQLEQYKQQTQSLVDVISEKEKLEDEKTQEIYSLKQLGQEKQQEYELKLNEAKAQIGNVELQLSKTQDECQRLVTLNEQHEKNQQIQAEKHQQDIAAQSAETAKISENLTLVQTEHAKDQLALEQMQEQIIKTQSTWQEQLDDMSNQLETMSASLHESQALNEQYQHQISTLTKQLESANDDVDKVQQRFESNRGKQELEYNKARETIKYLRDENLELNTKLEQQVNELEDKLTEYRLRFEYAQKQLEKKS